MANELTNIKIEPCNVTWGNPETTKVTLVADSAGSLNDTYFTGYLPTGVGFYVWFNINSAGVDPAPSGFATEIEVAGATGASAATLQAAAVTAINAISGLNAKADPNDSDSLILQNEAVGTVTAVVTDTGSTGFTLTQLRAGSSFSVGYIEGDVEFSLEEDFYDVTAQQEGTTIIEKIRTGSRVTGISIAMKEGVASKLKTVLEAGGASVTPAGGTEVTGWGSSKRFTGVTNQCRRLILSPVRLGSSDRSEDMCAWRAYPLFQNTNFSGETAKMINVEFVFLPDALIADAQNHFVVGDHQQLLLK